MSHTVPAWGGSQLPPGAAAQFQGQDTQPALQGGDGIRDGRGAPLPLGVSRAVGIPSGAPGRLWESAPSLVTQGGHC